MSGAGCAMGRGLNTVCLPVLAVVRACVLVFLCVFVLCLLCIDVLRIELQATTAGATTSATATTRRKPRTNGKPAEWTRSEIVLWLYKDVLFVVVVLHAVLLIELVVLLHRPRPSWIAICTITSDITITMWCVPSCLLDV